MSNIRFQVFDTRCNYSRSGFVEKSVYTYTFNNTPAGTIVYPQLISGTGVQNKIIFKTFAYALPNSQLVGTNSPVGAIKIYYLNNLNKDDTNYAVGVGISSFPNASSYGSFNIGTGYGGFELGTSTGSNRGSDCITYPYLALKVQTGTIISGTLIIVAYS